MIQRFVSQLVNVVEMGVSRRGLMLVSQLNGVVNQKVGLVVDWRVCEVGEFCQFLMYYCQGVTELQFISGNFFVCVKGTLQQSFNYNNNLNNNNLNINNNNFNPYQQQQQQCSHSNNNHHHCHYIPQPHSYYCQFNKQ